MARPTPRCLFRPALSMLRSTRGSLLLALLMTISFSALGSPFFTIGMTETRLQRRSTIEMAARGVAEAGVELAMLEYNAQAGAFAPAGGWAVVAAGPQCPVGRCVQRNYAVTTAPENTVLGTASILVKDVDALPPSVISVISTGTLAAMEGGTVVEVTLQRGSGAGRGFLHAAFAGGSYDNGAGTYGLYMHSAALTDSYDSTLGPYSAFPPRTHGDVGANYPTDGIILTSNVQGDAYVGPAGNPSTAIVGTVTGTKQNLTQTISLPAVVMPTCDAAHELGAEVLVSGATRILGPGTWCADSIVMEGQTSKLSTTGAVKLYVRDYVIIRAGAQIEADGGTSIHPENMQIYIKPGGAYVPYSHPSISWMSPACPNHRVCMADSDGINNNKVTATLYAPDARIVLASYIDWYGAVVGYYVNFASGHVHYDEHLASVTTTDYGTGPGPGVTVISWTRRALQ